MELQHYLRRLCPGFFCLRQVHVHLVPVEIGVVGRAHALVEAEGSPRHDLANRVTKNGWVGKDKEAEEDEGSRIWSEGHHTLQTYQTRYTLITFKNIKISSYYDRTSYFRAMAVTSPPFYPGEYSRHTIPV